MSDGIQEAELPEIQQRAARALAVAPTPGSRSSRRFSESAAEPSYSSAMTQISTRSCTSGCTEDRTRSPRLTSALMPSSTARQGGLALCENAMPSRKVLRVIRNLCGAAGGSRPGRRLVQAGKMGQNPAAGWRCGGRFAGSGDGRGQYSYVTDDLTHYSGP